LLEKLPSHFSTYYEPFLGGGALLIELYNKGILKNAVVSDINLELINLYTAIKNCPDEVVYYIKNLDFKNAEDDYYKARELYNSIKCMIKTFHFLSFKVPEKTLSNLLILSCILTLKYIV